jgi:hypothetical protein
MSRIQKLPKRRNGRILPVIVLLLLLVAISGFALAFAGTWSDMQQQANLGATRQVEAGQTAVHNGELTLQANP